MASYSNSALVSHTKLSPNCTKPRTKPICRVSIHCMAGNLSVESCGSLFASSSREASSNYGIGSDGRVGMYVEECNRSWCTSSGDNDHQAVTIEVANSVAKAPWPVSDAAMNSLVNLVADICKRNGKTTVVWISDKTKALAYKPKSNEMLLTVHRWFAAKECPGSDLLTAHPDIVTKVNKLLSSGTSVKVESVPATPKEDIWKWLAAKGLNDFAIAGIMGNMYAESGLIANNLQNTFEAKLGYTDDTYTKAVDSGKYTKFATDGAGYGLCQWTHSSRKSALLAYAKKVGKSIADTVMQLEFMWSEMQSMPKLMTALKAATSVKAASDAFLTEFEKPANAASAKGTRAAYAQTYYDKYHGKGTANASALPYKVRITASDLNIRKEPSTAKGNATVVGSIKDNGIYTIVEESTGQGASMWGKLKSGAGWISLDYTKKI